MKNVGVANSQSAITSVESSQQHACFRCVMSTQRFVLCAHNTTKFWKSPISSLDILQSMKTNLIFFYCLAYICHVKLDFDLLDTAHAVGDPPRAVKFSCASGEPSAGAQWRFQCAPITHMLAQCAVNLAGESHWRSGFHLDPIRAARSEFSLGQPPQISHLSRSHSRSAQWILLGTATWDRVAVQIQFTQRAVNFAGDSHLRSARSARRAVFLPGDIFPRSSTCLDPIRAVHSELPWGNLRDQRSFQIQLTQCAVIPPGGVPPQIRYLSRYLKRDWPHLRNRETAWRRHGIGWWWGYRHSEIHVWDFEDFVIFFCMVSFLNFLNHSGCLDSRFVAEWNAGQVEGVSDSVLSQSPESECRYSASTFTSQNADFASLMDNVKSLNIWTTNITGNSAVVQCDSCAKGEPFCACPSVADIVSLDQWSTVSLIIEVVDFAILGIFLIEITAKTFAFGKPYICDPWNAFDAFIVLLSISLAILNLVVHDETVQQVLGLRGKTKILSQFVIIVCAKTCFGFAHIS